MSDNEFLSRLIWMYQLSQYYCDTYNIASLILILVNYACHDDEMLELLNNFINYLNDINEIHNDLIVEMPDIYVETFNSDLDLLGRGWLHLVNASGIGLPRYVPPNMPSVRVVDEVRFTLSTVGKSLIQYLRYRPSNIHRINRINTDDSSIIGSIDIINDKCFFLSKSSINTIKLIS